MAIKLFPENDLHQNLDLSSMLSREILKLETSPVSPEVEQYNLLKKEIMATKFYKDLMVIYLQLQLKYEESLVFNDTNKKFELWTRLNELAGEDCIPEFNFSKLKRSAIKSKKAEMANYYKVRDEYIESKKAELIKPITLEWKHLTILITAFSVLFLCGGFLYTKYLFWALDAEVTWFFTVSDYLSSSIDVVFGAIISTLLSFMFFMKGVSEQLHREIHNYQFKIESKRKDLWIYIVIPLVVLSIFIELHFDSGRTLTPQIILLSAFVAMELVGRIRLERYINNAYIFIFFTVAILMFCAYIVLKAEATIRQLNLNSSPEVELNLKNEYKKFSGYKLITVNSGYTFIYSGNKVVVIPKDAVLYYTN